jgi:hypothetical protein
MTSLVSVKGVKDSIDEMSFRTDLIHDQNSKFDPVDCYVVNNIDKTYV